MSLTIFIILVILVILALYVYSTYNTLVKLSNTVDEAFSTMDVYLKKRWDLIPNLVETVKGYAKHEKGTLEAVVKLRTTPYSNMSKNDKISTNEELTTELSKLMLLVESYPDLKANQNFMDLNKQLTKNEEDIANSRKYFNAVVKNMNNKIEMFPSNIIARIFNYKTLKMFEASSSERENVKVDFS